MTKTARAVLKHIIKQVTGVDIRCRDGLHYNRGLNEDAVIVYDGTNWDEYRKVWTACMMVAGNPGWRCGVQGSGGGLILRINKDPLNHYITDEGSTKLSRWMQHRDFFCAFSRFFRKHVRHELTPDLEVEGRMRKMLPLLIGISDKLDNKLSKEMIK